jgi:hypothetical protein
MPEHIINKAVGSPLWNRYCRTCIHQPVQAHESPCRGCWNPGGDMYEFSPGEAEYASWAALDGKPKEVIR